MEKEILVNPTVRWACRPDDQPTLQFLDGTPKGAVVLPNIGDVLTMPYIVDPLSGQPAEVRVLDIVKMLGPEGHVLAVVVQRTDGHPS